MKFITFASTIIASGALAASVCHHDIYECCTGCKVIEVDDEGRWGAENRNWCLIDEEKCKGYRNPAYPECKGCDVYLTDLEATWGAENNQWCYIDEIKCGLKESEQDQKEPEQDQKEPEQDQKEPEQDQKEPEQDQKELEQNQNEQEQEPEQGQTKPEEFEFINNSLPIISIVSSSGNKDFFEKPVSKIAQSMGSHFNDPNYVAPPEPYFEECSITITDAEGKKMIENAKANVKVRGNFTSKYSKKPLRIKFDDTFNLFGMNNNQEFKDWVLLAGFKDYSMVRDKSMLDISRDILNVDGFYSADTRYVEVYLNGDYVGLYILTEQQQVNQGRVNVTAPEENYEGTDIGYFVEHDGYANTEEPLFKFRLNYHNNDALKPYDGKNGTRSVKPASAGFMGGFMGGGGNESMTIKSDVYSQEQHDFIQAYLDNVYSVLYEAAYNNKAFEFNEEFTEIVESQSLTPQQAIEKVIDVQSLVDAYLLNEIACDADVAFSSFYMDVDFGSKRKETGKLIFEAPWDFDSGLGLKNFCRNGQGLHAANGISSFFNSSINPWLAILMYQEWYQDLIRKKWSEINEKGIVQHAIDNIHKDCKSYEKAFVRDFEKYDTKERRDYISGEAIQEVMALKTQAEQAEYVAEWLEKRANFINSIWLE